MATAADPCSSPLLEGTFDIHGNQSTVTLTTDSLKWRPATGTLGDGLVIPVEEILSATLSTVAAKSRDVSAIQLVYIRHKQKNQDLRRETVDLEGKAEVCVQWTQRIQESIRKVPGKPRNALVLVNPGCGNKKGQRQYKGTVAPVFREASVKTHVIKSADHVRDIISGYDLTAIDSIVTVGGDGTCHLAMAALLRRQMREADLDLDNPDNDVPLTILSIGVIPCGSGNLFAFQCYGSTDIETAALAIVRGGRQKLNVQWVRSGGKFVGFSFLAQTIGALADIVEETDHARYMGKLRYSVYLIKYALKASVRTLDVTIETRPPVTDMYQAQDDAKTEHGATSEGTQPWQSFRDRIALFIGYTSDYIGLRKYKDVAHLGFSDVIMMKHWGRARYYKFIKQLGRFDPAAIHGDNKVYIPCVEYRVTLNNPEEQGRNVNLLNIDGETYRLEEPNYQVKLFPERINMFASASKELLIENNPNFF